LAVGKKRKKTEKRRSEEEKKLRIEEGEKTSLRFPQTFEATAPFSIHINCKRVLLAGWFR
jgi:hypothetical protein